MFGPRRREDKHRLGALRSTGRRSLVALAQDWECAEAEAAGLREALHEALEDRPGLPDTEPVRRELGREAAALASREDKLAQRYRRLWPRMRAAQQVFAAHHAQQEAGPGQPAAGPPRQPRERPALDLRKHHVALDSWEQKQRLAMAALVRRDRGQGRGRG